MADDLIEGGVIRIDASVWDNLDKVDKKIKDIANDSELMAEHFGSAMIRMGNGSSLLLKKLESMKTAISNIGVADMSKFNSVGTSMSSLSDNASQAAENVSRVVSALDNMSDTTSSGSGKINEEKKMYSQMSALIDNMNTKEEERSSGKRKRTDSAIAQEKRQTDAMEREAKRRERIAEREARREVELAKAQERRTNNKAIDAYNRAMASSEATMSQRINKIAKLRQSEEMMSKATKDYSKEIDGAREAMDRLNKKNEKQVEENKKVERSHRKLMDTSGQLMRKLALVFSVSQIKTYLMNVVNVTGEFEKQNVALAAILRNKEQANQLFGQITALAVKSPFQLKELITYTKSLSAYQIEYEKLYDTTKMLADVSSGLGVDMQRLILAFGQVKAANFLRGTEVRQFTEAGFNILGELAEYYSELEGTMVSVGQVQDMVTKRMVAFGDVEEVFKRVTREGGIFYNMQEKQAETIAGQMSNLRDSMDIMFNKIGTENYDVIRGLIEAIKSLVSNYDAVAAVLKSITGALVLYKLNLVLSNEKLVEFAVNSSIMARGSAKSLTIIQLLRVAFLKLSTAIGTAGSAMKSFVVKNKYVLALVAIVAAVHEAVHWNDEYNESLKEVSKQRNTDIAELQKLKDAYDGVTESADRANKAKENSVSAEDIYKGKFAELVKLKRMVEDKGYTLPVNIEFVTSENIDEVFNKGADMLKNASDFGKEFSMAMNKGFTATEGWMHIFGDNLKTDLEQLSVSYEKVGNAFKSNLDTLENELITVSSQFTGSAKEYYEQLKQGKSNEESETQWALRRLGLISKINYQYRLSDGHGKNAVQNNVLLTKLLWERSDILREEKEAQEEVEKAVSKLIEDYGGLERLKKYAGDNPILIRTEIDRFFEKQELGEEAKRFAEFWASNTLEIPFTFEKPKDMPTFFKDFRDTVKVLDTSGVFKDQLQSISSIAQLEDALQKKYKEEIGNQNVLNRSNTERLNLTRQIEEVQKRISDEHLAKEEQEAAELTLKNLKEQKGVIDKTISDGKKQSETVIGIIKSIGDAFNLDYIGSKKELKSQNDILKEQISLIKEAGEAYKKLIEYREKDKAIEQVKADFGKAFKNASLDINMDFSEEGIIKKLESISKMMTGKEALALQKDISKMKTEIGIEVNKNDLENIQREIQGAISSYELSFELTKTGIDPNIIKNFLNLDTLNFDQLMNKWNSEFKPRLEKMGNQGREVILKFEKSITEISEKENKERLKRFSDYLKEYTDKIKQAQEEAVNDISFAGQLLDSGKINASQYGEIVQSIVKETDDKISKINTDKFKESAEYIQAMGDLSAYSAEQLKNMLNQLKELTKADSKTMSASDMKVYAKAISNVREQLDKVKWPFEKTEFRKFKEMITLQKDYSKEVTNSNHLEREREELLDMQGEATDYLGQLEDKRKKGDNSTELSNKINNQKKIVEYITDKIGVADGKIADSKIKVSEISGKMGKLTGGAGKALAMVDMIIKGVYQSIKATIDMFNELSELAESFGKDTSQGKWQQAGVFFKYMGEMNDKAMAGWESLKKGDVMGASVKSVGAVFSVIKGINALGDNKKEQRIRREMELIEDLQKSYEKLRDKIDEAYDVDTLSKSTKLMNESLKEQNEALERAIKSEEDKKKTDHNRIEEWREQIEENQKIIKENADELIDSLGGIGSADAVRNAAQEFTDAWLDSYLEVGDGLKGLEDNMKNMMKNVVSKQLTATLAKQYVEPFIKELRKGFDANSLGGIELKSEEIAKVAEAYKQAMVGADKSFTAVLDALKEAGVDISAMGKKDELSGLQKGIQGTSETTSDIIAALMESIRFFSADSNAQLKSMFNMLVNPPVENPFISEMRMQTEQLKLMYSLWNGMSKTIPGSGKVLKVQMV